MVRVVVSYCNERASRGYMFECPDETVKVGDLVTDGMQQMMVTATYPSDVREVRRVTGYWERAHATECETHKSQ